MAKDEKTVEFHLDCECSQCEERFWAADRANRSEEALARITAKIKDWSLIWIDFKVAVENVLEDWAKYHRLSAGDL